MAGGGKGCTETAQYSGYAKDMRETYGIHRHGKQISTTENGSNPSPKGLIYLAQMSEDNHPSTQVKRIFNLCLYQELPPSRYHLGKPRLLSSAMFNFFVK